MANITDDSYEVVERFSRIADVFATKIVRALQEQSDDVDPLTAHDFAKDLLTGKIAVEALPLAREMQLKTIKRRELKAIKDCATSLAHAINEGSAQPLVDPSHFQTLFNRGLLPMHTLGAHLLALQPDVPVIPNHLMPISERVERSDQAIFALTIFDLYANYVQQKIERVTPDKSVPSKTGKTKISNGKDTVEAVVVDARDNRKNGKPKKKRPSRTQREAARIAKTEEAARAYAIEVEISKNEIGHLIEHAGELFEKIQNLFEKNRDGLGLSGADLAYRVFSESLDAWIERGDNVTVCALITGDIENAARHIDLLRLFLNEVVRQDVTSPEITNAARSIIDQYELVLDEYYIPFNYVEDFAGSNAEFRERYPELLGAGLTTDISDEWQTVFSTALQIQGPQFKLPSREFPWQRGRAIATFAGIPLMGIRTLRNDPDHWLAKLLDRPGQNYGYIAPSDPVHRYLHWSLSFGLGYEFTYGFRPEKTKSINRQFNNIPNSLLMGLAKAPNALARVNDMLGRI